MGHDRNGDHRRRIDVHWGCRHRGCNSAKFTVTRPRTEIDLLDTLTLGLGSATAGFDFDETFSQIIMNRVTERDVVLSVFDDGIVEGVEFVEIFFEYVNSCGELVTTSSRVAFWTPSVTAEPAVPGCLNADGTQELGYDVSMAMGLSILTGMASSPLP